MISKNQAKYLKALSSKKQRRLSGEFLVQGEKNILELLGSSLEVVEIYCTDSFKELHNNLLSHHSVIETTAQQLSQVSTLTANSDAIAIVKQPVHEAFQPKGLILALDDVNDPGNLGTIIRLADWYGVNDILISEQTSDVYNPKTISATMGAFTRVKTHRVNLKESLQTINLPIYGAFLGGDNVHNNNFEKSAVIVMGNESHGISDDISSLITKKVTIPSYGHSESLNVAMATGIILDNARRILSNN